MALQEGKKAQEKIVIPILEQKGWGKRSFL